MEENREPLSAIAIEKKLQLLRNKHFSEDTIALVKSDYEYGLKEEEISLYLNKSYDIEQMKILSECLHKDVPKDVIDIIKNTKYSVHQMQVSLEFYEKGVPVQTINYYNSNTVKAVAIALGIYAMAIVMYYTSQRRQHGSILMSSMSCLIRSILQNICSSSGRR